MAHVLYKRDSEHDPSTFECSPRKRMRKELEAISDNNNLPSRKRFILRQSSEPRPDRSSSFRDAAKLFTREMEQKAHFQSIDKRTKPVALEDKSRDNENRLFTFEQLMQYCQTRMLEQRERIREEYEETLKLRLSEQYNTFINFNHDQLVRQLKSVAISSYLS